MVSKTCSRVGLAHNTTQLQEQRWCVATFRGTHPPQQSGSTCIACGFLLLRYDHHRLCTGLQCEQSGAGAVDARERQAAELAAIPAPNRM